MARAQRFDDVIIGSGQGGVPLAMELAGAGRKVALVEREHIGGSCINHGCTPTKTMAASARVAYLTGRARDFGVRAKKVSVDVERVRARARAIVRDFRGGEEVQLEETNNLTVVRGAGRFLEPAAIEVRKGKEVRRLSAERFFVDVGVRPAVPALPGLEEVPFLDSTSIQDLDLAPEHLLILGAGYIGLEFGQMFRRFGSEVTMVEASPRLLPREDEDVALALAAVLREDGIALEIGVHPRSVARRKKGRRIELTVARGERGKPRRIAATHLLVATGQRPNTDSLALERAGVQTNERGYITVNERLETSAAGIWALGDCTGAPAFTHVSYDHYRVLRDNLLGAGGASTSGRLVPSVLYTDPELAHVGLREREAQERRIAYRKAVMPMSSVARALEMDESRGMLKSLVAKEDDRILGFTCLGVEAGELMSMVEIAMMAKLPYTALREGVFAHPTLAECLNNLYANLES